MSFKKFIKKFIPDFLLNFYHYLLALTGVFLYGSFKNKIKIIGVTGTSGKTTVVNLTTKILEKAGYKTASISSIKFKIGEKEWENKLKMTMPGRFKIQKFLKRAVKENCQYAVLEVTSEGIKQYRHKFISFDTAVFTNLSPEHIESHKGFENYRKAKLELFKNTKNIHIVNLDDENAKYFLESFAEKKYGYTMNPVRNEISNGVNNEQRIPPLSGNDKKLFIVYCSLFSVGEKGISFKIENTQFNLNLLGKFNIYNALVAISVGLSQNVSLGVCVQALEKSKGIPGRMEIVIKEPFKVIVDYAHTPEQLENVYKAFKDNSLICVLGSCGGGRDKWKRPVLGKLAAQYCKEIFITNEDPYDENPDQILSMIKSGISNDQFPSSNLYEILDRKKAIKKALEIARPNDVVIITGKGSEPWMCVKNNKKISWDDRKIVREEFQRIKK